MLILCQQFSGANLEHATWYHSLSKCLVANLIILAFGKKVWQMNGVSQIVHQTFPTKRSCHMVYFIQSGNIYVLKDKRWLLQSEQ